MKINVIVHNAQEGGYWAEVPSIPGCHAQGEDWEELLSNLYEAVEGCLSIDFGDFETDKENKVIEIVR